jgi:DNA-binding NarL/FixJ family response regulator
MVTGLGAIIASIAIEDKGSLTESAPSPNIRVLIVEDHEPFRRFLGSKLQQHANMEIIGEPEDGLQAVQQADFLQPDLILLDIGLPHLNGMEAARQIRKRVPKARIIFVTLESSEDVVAEAFALGASGYLLKGQVESQLLAAIDAVSKGLRFVCDGLDGTESSSQPKP